MRFFSEKSHYFKNYYYDLKNFLKKSTILSYLFSFPRFFSAFRDEMRRSATSNKHFKGRDGRAARRGRKRIGLAWVTKTDGPDENADYLRAGAWRGVAGGRQR